MDSPGMIIDTGIGYEITSFASANDVANILYNEGDFNGAKAALDIAWTFAQKNREHNEKKDLKKFFGILGDVLGELGKFDEAVKAYESLHCIQMQLNSNIFKNRTPEPTIRLYQFKKFSDYNLSNLLKSEITLSRPNQMNDIVDSLVYTWLESPLFGKNALYKNHLKPYAESFRDYRIASFCEDNPEKGHIAILNTLLWSHYAEQHYGFCIEYLFDESILRHDDFKNKTISRLMRIVYNSPNKSISFDASDRSLNTQLGFMTKSHEWEYENEVRLIQYKANNGQVREQYELEGASKIVAIYFGYRCPESNIEIVKKLLADKDVKFYKMAIDYSNVYKLTYYEV